MVMPRLFTIGGAHIDRRGQTAGVHIAATSNPGRMREEIGGGAFNAARVVARRDIVVSLLSLRGGDGPGAQVADAIAAAGMEDLSAVFLDRATPSYTAILDENGDLITGFADMELYDTAFAKQVARRQCRDAVAAADAVLCDANMPQAALEKLADMAEGKPLFAIAISPAKVGRLVSSFEQLSCLFMNEREARSLTELSSDKPVIAAIEGLRKRGLANGVITAGSQSVLLFTPDAIMEITPPAAQHVADVTGAGDALAGASIAAMMRRKDLAEAVREGVAAAVLTVESASVAPKFNDTSLRDTLARVPAARRIGPDPRS